jgi:hypothetical protein
MKVGSKNQNLGASNQKSVNFNLDQKPFLYEVTSLEDNNNEKDGKTLISSSSGGLILDNINNSCSI